MCVLSSDLACVRRKLVWIWLGGSRSYFKGVIVKLADLYALVLQPINAHSGLKQPDNFEEIIQA